MIRKRQTWSDQENEMLIKIMADNNPMKVDSALKWERISIEMAKNGFQKTAKQCRERYYKKMDPKIES
jgi:hypothetical protein